MLPDAALANKITALDEPASAKDIPKPSYAPLVDYLRISPESNLETADVDSLKKHRIVLLHEYSDGSAWEWSAVLTSTNRVRRLEGHGVVAKVKFPEGSCDVYLERDELVYKEKWALLYEEKEGARAKKKTKITKKATDHIKRRHETATTRKHNKNIRMSKTTKHQQPLVVQLVVVYMM